MDALTKQDDGLVRQVISQCGVFRLQISPETPCNLHASRWRTQWRLLRPPRINYVLFCLAQLASPDVVASLCAVAVSIASSQPALTCRFG